MGEAIRGNESGLHVNDIIIAPLIRTVGACLPKGGCLIFTREMSSRATAEKVQHKNHHADNKGNDEQGEGEK